MRRWGIFWNFWRKWVVAEKICGVKGCWKFLVDVASRIFGWFKEITSCRKVGKGASEIRVGDVVVTEEDIVPRQGGD